MVIKGTRWSKQLEPCKICKKRPRDKGKGVCRACRKAADGSQVYLDYLAYDRKLEFEELVVLGMWAGDGNWKDTKTPEIAATQTNAKEFQNLLNRLRIRHGLYLDKREFRTEPLWRFNLYQQYGMRMVDLGFDVSWRGAQNKQFPESLITKENAPGLLTGLWMSDGSVSGVRPAYYTTSPILSGQVMSLIQLRGNESNVYDYPMKSGKRMHIPTLAGKTWESFEGGLKLWGNRT